MRSILGLLLLVISGTANANYLPVDFSEFHNRRLQIYSGTLPQGDVILDDVNWTIPSGDPSNLIQGKNIWHSALLLDGSDPANDFAARSLIIDSLSLVNIFRLHLLINTVWGETEPGPLAFVEVFGTNGAYYRLDLDANDEIRDFRFGMYTNTINNTATQAYTPFSYVPGETGFHATRNAYIENAGQPYVPGSPNPSEIRLDHLEFDLPSIFLSESITQIRITDQGGEEIQRVFVAGITAESVPEPGTFILLGSAMVGLALYRRRRSQP